MGLAQYFVTTQSFRTLGWLSAHLCVPVSVDWFKTLASLFVQSLEWQKIRGIMLPNTSNFDYNELDCVNIALCMGYKVTDERNMRIVLLK